jgi:hypothetical protein
MGHSQITTTERYLHARPAGELADRFTAALAGSERWCSMLARTFTS